MISVCSRLLLNGTKELQQLILASKTASKATEQWATDLNKQMSKLYEIWKPIPLESIFLSLCELPTENHGYLSIFLTRLQNQKLEINGNDLKKMGFKEGPHFRVVLQQLLNDKLNGRQLTKQQQLDEAVALLKEREKQTTNFSSDNNVFKTNDKMEE